MAARVATPKTTDILLTPALAPVLRPEEWCRPAGCESFELLSVSFTLAEVVTIEDDVCDGLVVFDTTTEVEEKDFVLETLKSRNPNSKMPVSNHWDSSRSSRID